MKTVEETLAELIDREEIRDLPVRYCDCVWRGDVAGIADLFAAAGWFTVKPPHPERKNAKWNGSEPATISTNTSRWATAGNSHHATSPRSVSTPLPPKPP